MNYSLTSLLELPLFLGMGRSELESIEDAVQIAGTHVKRGAVLVRENDACDSLLIVVKGSVIATTHSDDHSYSVEELLQAPMVIQPEYIFGIRQRYTSTFKTSTYCEVIRIDKQMVLKLMDISMTFRLNLINIVATQSQRSSRRLWNPQHEDISKRIVRFIKDHTLHPAGHKTLRIKMTTMAKELGCSRLEVSEALHQLEEKQLIIVKRSIIEVPVLQLL